ncbi:MAG: histidinol-phosphate transaminase [Gammaproteobacteria bacterium]|nr:histidinol-phosphate transaminase [Gammaproteobacteria bacterium]NNC97205.1 histidinol-phosphate transaminase [Gammaproteobacteria bacterium]NNM14485.1 histidinol-phosphate transaminase [Gammaproteobacteria bacterium]
MNIQSVINMARPEIRALKSYDNLRGTSSVEAIILDSNENIASPDATLTKEKRFRYPEIRAQQLIERLAGIYQVRAEQIMLGRGSDDVIDSLCRVFLRAGQDAILQTTPCFSMYSISAQIQGAVSKSVALDSANDFAYDVDAILNAIRPEVKLIFLATPQSPTGNSLAKNDVLRLLDASQDRCVVVIDEAYIEFSPHASMASLLDKYPNLIIMRTLSKAYGLANLRCGAMLAHPDVVKLVRKVVTPYALPGIVVDTTYAALEPENLEAIRQINASMPKRKQALQALVYKQAWCQGIVSGDTNFILVKTDKAQALNEFLETQQIYIRSFSPSSELGDYLRFSVGNFAEIDTLQQAFEQFANRNF